MEKREIGLVLAGLAEYYNKTLSQSQLEMYSEDLLDLKYEELRLAIKTYRLDPRNVFFPLPSQLKACIGLIDNPDDECMLIVGKIVSCISSIGPYRQSEARENIGEIGWKVVESEGGWENVCKIVDDENLGIFKAQWRNLAKIHAQREVKKIAMSQIFIEQDLIKKINVNELLHDVPK